MWDLLAKEVVSYEVDISGGFRKPLRMRACQQKFSSPPGIRAHLGALLGMIFSVHLFK
jgi:hypothetical protein